MPFFSTIRLTNMQKFDNISLSKGFRSRHSLLQLLFGMEVGTHTIEDN